jgi:hypothetical protein
MTKQVHGNPAGKIEIASAVLIDEVTMLAAYRTYAATGIDRHQWCDRHRKTLNLYARSRKRNGGPSDRHLHVI